jgi:hypothetical protein
MDEQEEHVAGAVHVAVLRDGRLGDWVIGWVTEQSGWVGDWVIDWR